MIYSIQLVYIVYIFNHNTYILCIVYILHICIHVQIQVYIQHYHTLQIATVDYLKILCKLVFAKTWPNLILSQNVSGLSCRPIDLPHSC